MKFVMLTDYAVPHIGGVERHVQNLSLELTRQGHSVTILTRRYDPSLAKEEWMGKVRVLRFTERPGLPFMKGSLWPSLIAETEIFKQADAVHVHDHTLFMDAYLPFRLRFPGKPVFATFHGHEGRFPPARRHIAIRKLVEKLTRGNICVGHYLEKWYGTRSGAVTYGAVRSPGQMPPPDEHSILYLGRFEPDTGLLTFLQAFSLIQRTLKDSFRLCLCGEGSLWGKVRAFASRNDSCVEVVGKVVDPMPWIGRSRFVFASGYLSMLEAMVSQRLVFAAYDNPLKKDYWMMMPGAQERMEIAGTPDDLAERFCSLLEEPAREAAMKARAYEFASQQSWENMRDLYLKLYASAGVV